MTNLIDNFDALIILLDDGSTDVGEALFCECGTLCAINAHGATISGAGELTEGDKVNCGDTIYRVVKGPLPEIYVGEGFDDGKEDARENECDVCCNERDLSKVTPELPAFITPLREMFDGPTTAKYRWKISKDYIADEGAEPGTNLNAKGVEGPSNLDSSIKDNRAKFVMKDDDLNTYYEGYIYGDYEGFEPLTDFGTPNAGAVRIFYGGKEL